MSFTAAECLHVLRLLIDAERRGEYYGPRDQYWVRNKRIEDKIKAHVGKGDE